MVGTGLDSDTTSEPPQYDLDAPGLYLNRELSWLEFNERVLAEALDSRNPLYERVRFLSITSSNLDEFYAKRVAWLKQMEQRSPAHRTVDGMTIAEQAVAVHARAARMRLAIEGCWNDVISPLLATRGLRIVPIRLVSAEARAQLRAYFMAAIYPVLTPLVVDPAHPFPFISAGSLSLVLSVRDPRTGHARFARVKVPQNRPRFVEAGDGVVVLLEDLIEAHLDILFPGVEIAECRVLRVLRSIELGEPSEAADDLLELIEQEVRRRRLGQAVSMEVAGPFSHEREQLLLEELRITGDDIVLCQGPLGLADLAQLIERADEDDLFAPFTPAVPSAFADASDRALLFSALQGSDHLVHHPYESFDATVARLVEEAAHDPAVLAIKQTMYRTSPDSPILRSLITAATRGKQVAVLVELTARMDEENNIEWARRLEEAGVHVAYGNPAQKIHSKICLIVREEPSGVVLYGHIGTGNYNSRTARVYTDFGLFTTDPAICGDLVRVFNYLTGLSQRLDTTELLVAPESLRSELERRIRREIEFARAGRPARVVLKMNALEDYQFTRLLYQASQAGVQVDLIVRGICRLRPGIPGLSERIRVVSVIGRFLEHSRVFSFLNDGDRECFIGSADAMKRNLDERIEVLTPVHDPSLRGMLERTLELLLNDERQAWVLSDETWTRAKNVDAPGVHAQLLSSAPFS